MGMFVRRSSGPSDKYGSFVYYVDDNGFVRQSTGPNDKYGSIVYYAGEDDFIRKATGPSDEYGEIVYYWDDAGFIRRSNGPSDRCGQIVYYVGDDDFVRIASGPNDKYGQVVFYIQEEKRKKKEKKQTTQENKGGILLVLALVIGLIFAPILLVLGMFGKFLLGGLFENVLPIEAFKKFRKTYSIICISWLVLGIAAIVVLAILEISVEIPLYALVGGNVLLFILSIVIGNKIYNEHKDELPQTTEDAEDEIDTSSVEEPIFEESVNADMPANNEDLQYDSYSVPPTQAEPVGVDTAQLDAMTRELESYKAMLDGGLISKGEYNNLKDILFRKYGISKESAPKKGVSSASLRKANIGVLITAIVCWVVGLFFMFGVRGYEYSYRGWAVAERAGYSLLELFDKDVLSCLSVIFIFVFGIALAADFILNLICSKKWALINSVVEMLKAR